jgi:hypothetical protein
MDYYPEGTGEGKQAVLITYHIARINMATQVMHNDARYDPTAGYEVYYYTLTN